MGGRTLPVLQIERIGQRGESSIRRDILELLNHGSWFVGRVVAVLGASYNKRSSQLTPLAFRVSI
jgi:uncharacterized paraquat-inducible protein A